jgi:hypothetical protein
MAYVPPGVEIRQIQKTVSPTLITPDLVPAVVGPGFEVVNILEGFDSPYAAFNGSETVLTISGLDTSYMKLDQGSVYVDLVMPPSAATSAISAGARKIFTTALTTSTTTVTVPAAAGWSGAKVMVGFRALRSDLSALTLYSSKQEAVESFTDVSTLNPLGFSVMQALTNGNRATYGFGLRNDEYTNLVASGSNSINHALAQDELTMKEVYALAPLTVSSSIITSYKAHVDTYSTPVEKKERVVFVSPLIPWSAPGDPASNKAITALSTSTAAGSVSDKRVFYVFPDTAYAQEVRHISTLSSTYVNARYTTGFSTTVRAYLAQKVTFSATNSEVAYRETTVYPIPGIGVEITASLWNALVSHAQETTNPFFSAYVPVPGSVALTSAIAGQVAGNTPEQGLTNAVVAGVNLVKFSSDWFSESHLNTIAQGGNYILKQAKPTSTIVCRHQLSTDMSSVEKRELSITKTVDYTAKFVRNGVSPFIGKYVINSLTLSLLRATIAGAGELLKREFILNDFKILSLEQDSVNKDTVLVSLQILPPYPVNYIKIDLIF